MQPQVMIPESVQLARRALFGFILTFIAARTVVLLIMSHRMRLAALVYGIAMALTFDERRAGRSVLCLLDDQPERIEKGCQHDAPKGWRSIGC